MKKALLVLSCFFYSTFLYAQIPDTASNGSSKQLGTAKVIPHQATIRSLLLPGLGQIYNRQYWKVPIIYSGAVVAIFFLNQNQDLYNEYLAGYRQAYHSIAGAKTATVKGRVLTIPQLKWYTDQYQRRRDLTIILLAAGWVMNAIEANVAAHLSTFDLSEDLSLHIQPAILPINGIVSVIQLAVRFKN